MLESKAPDGTLQQFLSGENRYASLEKQFPDESKKLREKIEKDYAERYNILKAMAGPVSDEGKEKAEDKDKEE
jgi:pyruvate-ferredoxin/flavodoxin oxidoreductase